MIEFKANCGHTVRARDEDAGGAVRCSYCGKTVAVPDPAGGGLDFLFQELPAQGPEEKRPRSWFRGRFKPKAAKAAAKPAKDFDPFGIILRLCYFAALFVIVWVVSQRFVLPMLGSDEERARRLAGERPSLVPQSSDREPDARSDTNIGRGLLVERSRSGIYVASVPSGAKTFAIEASKAPTSGRIAHLSGVVQDRTDGNLPRVPDGTYVVEVALPWNDPGLNDPSFPAYNEYLEFRRNLARSSDSQRRKLQEDYFLPDEATTTFVADDGDQTYFVRQYRGVQVTQGRSPGVRALFLPRLGKSDKKAFSIEPLLYGYIPSQKRYGYDEKLVRAELHFYEVAPADQPAIMDALSRIGTIPYAAADGRVHIFKIDMNDGGFTTRVIREGGS